MASAKERLKIFENVIARVGLDGDVLGEYSKAMSALNGLETYTAMNPPPMPAGTPIESNPTPLGQNEGALPQMGEGGLNTPV